MSLEQHGKIKKASNSLLLLIARAIPPSICLMYCDISHKSSFEKKGGWAVLLKKKIISIRETKAKAAIG